MDVDHNSPDGRLENWTMLESSKGVVRFCGEIYDDKKGRFKDGTFVTTSACSAHYHSSSVIVTQNSIYKLGKKAS